MVLFACRAMRGMHENRCESLQVVAGALWNVSCNRRASDQAAKSATLVRAMLSPATAGSVRAAARRPEGGRASRKKLLHGRDWPRGGFSARRRRKGYEDSFDTGRCSGRRNASDVHQSGGRPEVLV